MSTRKTSLLFLLLALTPTLFSCAAVQVAVEHKNLSVQHRMSDSIFLPPTNEKTIFVDVRNTSDKEVNLSGIESSLAGRGYQVVADPEKAHFLLQVNVLFVGMTDPSAAQRCLANGFGGALVGGVGGALIGSTIGGSGLAAGAGGLAGMLVASLAESAINASVKNVTFTAVTDVQISERSKSPVKEAQRANMKQGSSTVVFQAQDRESNFLTYRTRVVSTANQVNLTWAEAEPSLEVGLTRSISGLF